MEKQVLSIKVSANFYKRLKTDIGRGNIGAFIEKVVSKELGNEKEKLEQEYRECYANPRMLKEAKQWEKVNIESWLNYEKNKNKKAK